MLAANFVAAGVSLVFSASQIGNSIRVIASFRRVHLNPSAVGSAEQALVRAHSVGAT